MCNTVTNSDYCVIVLLLYFPSSLSYSFLTSTTHSTNVTEKWLHLRGHSSFSSDPPSFSLVSAMAVGVPIFLTSTLVRYYSLTHHSLILLLLSTQKLSFLLLPWWVISTIVVGGGDQNNYNIISYDIMHPPMSCHVMRFPQRHSSLSFTFPMEGFIHWLIYRDAYQFFNFKS